METLTTPDLAAVSSITFKIPEGTTLVSGDVQTVTLSPTTEHAYFTGGAIKSIGTMGDGKIGGYLVVFGDENKKDSGGEWFHPATDFSLDYYTERPVLYHHGLGDIEAVKIGTIYSIKADSVGLYAEAILDINHEDPNVRMYARKAYQRVRANKLWWSSGSAINLTDSRTRERSLLDYKTSGPIDRWPIIEGSLTPTPADQTGRTSVSAIKSAISALETEEVESPKEPSAKGDDESAPVESVNGSIKSKQSKRKMSIKMGSVIETLESVGDLSPEQIIALAKAFEASGINSPVAVEPDADDATMAIDDVAAATPPAAEPPIMAKAQPAQPQGPSMAQVKGMIETALKTAAARTPVPGLTADPKSYQNDIVTYTPTQSLNAEDMSYMLHMRQLWASRTGLEYKPDVKLLRELAVKAQKQIAAGTTDLGFDAETKENQNNRVMAVKSNELDNTATANSAGNWVPELWSAQLWRRVRVPDRVTGQFQVVEMPSATYDLPVESTDPTVYFVPETTNNAQLSLASGAAIPSSLVGASKVQLIAKKLALRVGFSTEMMEDSIIPFIPQLRDQALITMQNAIENILENGDTTNSGANINGTPSGTTDKFLVFNAMRYLGLITNTQVSLNALGATPTLQMIRQARFRLISSLNSYALDPARLVIIVDQFTYGQMLNIDELLAWYNNGQGSTVNSGVMPKIDGIDVIPSAQLPLTDTTGVVNATSALNIYGTMLIASKDSWKVGYRRQVTSSLDYLPYYDSYQLTNTVRIAFQNKDNIANAVIYGLYTGYPAT